MKSLMVGLALSQALISMAAVALGPVTNPANGHSYYLLTPANWPAAEAEAVALGGHLVTINDAQENAWVLQTFKNVYGINENLWIGLQRTSPTSFAWSNGDPSAYRNWAPREPNGAAAGENYALMYSWNNQDGAAGQWNDAPLSFVEAGVVEVVPSDLVAVQLAWNNTTGGVDARYRVDNGALTTATTAKLFWASGTSISNIMSPTPIVPPETIPAGTGGPGSSGVITFNVPASSLGTPPTGATHLLLVLDHENAVTESNENNNYLALGPCCVTDFPVYSGPFDSDSLDDADATLRAHVEEFQTAVLALPGVQHFSVTAVYRPYAYQAHLREIRDKFVDLLLRVPGTRSDPIPYVVNGRQSGRPRLRFTPGTASMLCKAVMDHVNQECLDHTLVAVPPYDAPGVNRPQNSLHTRYPAEAVDLSISGQITDAQVGRLAADNYLIRPCTTEAHHFQLEGTACNAPALQGTFVGNSPINLLLEDPAGRRIGFNPATGMDVNEIGGLAEYSGSNSEPQVIVISPDQVLPGNYRITGVGTGSGAYTISLLVNGEDAVNMFADLEVGLGTASAGNPIAPVPPIDLALATVRLSIERLEEGGLLHWPAWTTNFILQSATTLAPTNWVPAVGVDYSDRSLAVTNTSAGTRFFRLQGP